MLKPAEFFQSHLACGLKSSDKQITLARGTAQKLDAVGKGNYTYLVLRGSSEQEVVRYTHIADYADRSTPDTIPVSRNVTTGGAKNFAPGTCVKHEWFGKGITEWVKQEAEVA